MRSTSDDLNPKQETGNQELPFTMGLKGKIEAIIYAAEEPVSLDHIALLVKEPALQELAEERARAEAGQAAAEPEVQSGTEPVLAEVPDNKAAAENTGGEDAQPEAPAVSATDPDPLDGHPPTEGAENPSAEQPAVIGPAALPEAVAAIPDNTGSFEASSDTPATEPPNAAATAEQPRSEASEKAKSTVASKRKAKADIPPEVRAKVRATLEELIADYSNPDRGMEIRQIAGGYRMTTKPEHHDVVKAFAKSLKPPLRLSLPALETLAVIAYKQPVTAPEVGEIRGVDSQGVIATLLDRKLITTAGRKAVIGRPILYKTTKEFLMRFGLNEISELPSMEEFEKLAQEAGQVDMFQSDEESGSAVSGEGTEAAAPDDDSLAPEDVETAVTESAVVESVAHSEQDSTAQSEAALPVEAESQPEPPNGSVESEPAKSEEPVH